MENLLLLRARDFEFYCLQLKASSGGGDSASTILKFPPMGMRVQCIFPIGMKFQGVISKGEPEETEVTWENPSGEPGKL